MLYAGWTHSTGKSEVKHIAKRLPELILPTGYYPLLAVQVGSDKVDGRSTRVIKQDFKALGYLVEGTGAQMVFSSISLVLGMNAGRNRRPMLSTCGLKMGFGGIYVAPGLQRLFACLKEAKVF